MSWASPGMLVRCVDVNVRKVAVGAFISDFEKKHVELLLEHDRVYMVREALNHPQFGDVASIRLEEIVRPALERIRRYRGKAVFDWDRPFLLDRFVPEKTANSRRPQAATERKAA